MNAQQMVKAGLIRPEGQNYVADDGRKFVRTYIGRRGTTLKWRIEGEEFCYRNMFEAYNRLQFD